MIRVIPPYCPAREPGVVGWPGFLTDEGVLVMGGLAASMLCLVLMGVPWPRPRAWDGE